MMISPMLSEPQDWSERTSQGVIVNSGNELVPRKETFSAKTFIEVSKTLQVAFPAVNKDWLMLLSTVLKDEGYSDADLKKTVLKVIKEETYIHQAPAIAKFCNQVKRVKLYTYYDLEVITSQGKDNWKNYGMVHRGKNGVLWAKRADIEKYDLEEIQPKQIYELPSVVSNDHA